MDTDLANLGIAMVEEIDKLEAVRPMMISGRGDCNTSSSSVGIIYRTVATF